MDIYPNTTIYVVCPANIASGGPELLHQLGSELIRQGFVANMYYYNRKHGVNPVPKVYQKYLVPYVDAIRDSSQNILIIPETLSILCSKIGGESIRKILWWLSVDNYLKSFSLHLSRYIERGDFLQSSLLNHGLVFPKYEFLEHWVQSEYARQFIVKNGVSADKIYYVGDYLSLDTHLPIEEHTANGRYDWVAFNPAKGFEFTKKLIANAKNVEWKPIHGMLPHEVHEVLLKSKVYIDFGNHPGQDRLPREAAIAGCCIITGMRGAAGNDIDVPVPIEYKFNDIDDNIPVILRKINYCIRNYDECQSDFYSYRSLICNQRAKFSKDVMKALPYTFFCSFQTSCVLFSSAELLKDNYNYFKNNITGYEVVGMVVDGCTDKIIKCEDNSYTVFELSECIFLYKEGRIKHFLVFNEEDESRLLALGVLRENIICLR